MKPFVVYASRTGNTKRVARVIAEELGVPAKDYKEVAEIPKGSFLVVGSGLYGKNIAEKFREFLNDLPSVEDGKAAVFETSGYGEGVIVGDIMAEILSAKGYHVLDKYVCPGNLFKIFRRSCPRPEDFDRARTFAKGLKGHLE